MVESFTVVALRLVQKLGSLLLRIAEKMGCVKILVVSSSMASMISVICTVATCYKIWSASPSSKAIPGVIFPAISEMGVELPQRRVYQVGFALTAIFLSLSIVFFEQLVGPRLMFPCELRQGSTVSISGLKAAPALNGTTGTLQLFDAATGRWSVTLKDGSVKAVKAENLVPSGGGETSASPAELLQQLLRWGHAAAGGIALQGVFTLERSVCLQSIIHWGGAILFMMGAMNHGKASNELYDLAKQRGVPWLSGHWVRRALSLRHLILDYSSVATFVLPLLMQMWPRASASNDETSAPSGNETNQEPQMDPTLMNAMGLMQWGIIGQFAIFFFTYIVDLAVAAPTFGRARVQASVRVAEDQTAHSD